MLMLSKLFFFNDTATTEIYPLSLHDALPISRGAGQGRAAVRGGAGRRRRPLLRRRQRDGVAAVRRGPARARGPPARPVARFDRAAAPSRAGGYWVARRAGRRRVPWRGFPRACPPPS